jgi:hypothetical protein
VAMIFISDWPKRVKKGTTTKGKSQLFTEAYRCACAKNGTGLRLDRAFMPTSVVRCLDATATHARPQDSRHFDVAKSSTFSAKTEQVLLPRSPVIFRSHVVGAELMLPSARSASTCITPTAPISAASRASIRSSSPLLTPLRQGCTMIARASGGGRGGACARGRREGDGRREGGPGKRWPCGQCRDPLGSGQCREKERRNGRE